MKKGCTNQPISAVEWVDPWTLRANDYNPNRVAPPEMELLKISILEDGWTQPIVAREDGEIVDGFHRYTLGTTDPDIIAFTDGLVPVVRVKNIDPAQQRMSTIRHNRARGEHGVLRMAEIVRELMDNHGITDKEMMRRLGMEDEEIDRLYDNSGMVNRGRAEGFGKGWEPG